MKNKISNNQKQLPITLQRGSLYFHVGSAKKTMDSGPNINTGHRSTLRLVFLRAAFGLIVHTGIRRHRFLLEQRLY